MLHDTRLLYNGESLSGMGGGGLQVGGGWTSVDEQPETQHTSCPTAAEVLHQPTADLWKTARPPHSEVPKKIEDLTKEVLPHPCSTTSLRSDHPVNWHFF